MNSEFSDKDIREVLKAHSVLPDDRTLDEVRELSSPYAELLQKCICELPASVRQKAILAYLEGALIQASGSKRKFVERRD